MLRDAVRSGTHPLFYRAAVSVAFNDPENALKELESVIGSSPRSNRAYEARELLTYLQWRRGDYRQARMQLQQMLALKPDADDVKKFLGLFTLLSTLPPQRVEKRRISKIATSTQDALRGPITINGVRRNYLFDTGANFSVISVSQARQLRLSTSRGSKETLGDGRPPYSLTVGDVALSDRIVIGDTTIRNVAFLIQPDERFTDTPEEQRGVIGLPVILALRTIRWVKGESLEFGFPSERRDAYRSNLCFDSAFSVVTVEFGQSRLNLSFDTGATLTDLYARFGRDFPEFVKAGRKGSAQRTGAGGTVRDEVVVVPDLHLRLGGFPGLLRSANMYPNENSPWHGNLGMDLLREARVVTIDFDAMRLTLSQ